MNRNDLNLGSHPIANACLVFTLVTVAMATFGVVASSSTPDASLAQHLPTHTTSTEQSVATPFEKSSYGKPALLPAPSSMSVVEFEEVLFPFLDKRKYVDLGWAVDKGVRDTGPFIDGTYYGTHPAVRIYYSPGIIEWLSNGRLGNIPDGEMIVKEQYPPPAIQHDGKSEQELRDSLESWTVMVKDSAGSHDGWFWSNPPANPASVDNREYPFDYPMSGFGIYCIRCHASTQSPTGDSKQFVNEYTFASLRNIKGFPGEPILFRVDDSWREQPQKQKPVEETEDSNSTEASETADDDSPASKHLRYHTNRSSSHPVCTSPEAAERCLSQPNSAFHKYFSTIPPQQRDAVATIPPITDDWVYQNAGASRDFLTSNQCMSCHAGLMKPFGPTMFLPTGETANYGDPGWNISPYGEWRWTPMGLAGRDPIFLAQMESEIARLHQEFPAEEADELTKAVSDTCLRCHGAMGKHQHAIDHAAKGKTRFTNSHHLATSEEASQDQDAKYGALARDGVSCMICHRAQPLPQPENDNRPYLKYFLQNSITGRLHFGEKGEIYGPYENDQIKPYAMQHAIGITPKHNKYLSSSQMCGSCHTVSLPSVDKPLKISTNGSANSTADSNSELIAGESEPIFKSFHHHLEQATYLEWLNSDYQNEFDPDNPYAKSCQDCHMSSGLSAPDLDIEIQQLESKIAIIQDTTYPDAENLATLDDLKIRVRSSGYRRHNFSGLNLFLLELFNQHDDILGVRKIDYMTGSKLDIEHAAQNFVQTARSKTAKIEVTAKKKNAKTLYADVLIENLAGHRFPTGVGFRRAFVELSVTIPSADSDSRKILWSSGRTNEVGVLVDQQGKALPEESFAKDENGKQAYHPHYSVIRSQDQVQVYETLLRDNAGAFTTSFVHGCERVKDNRLLPRGWSADGPSPEALSGVYLAATHPGEMSKRDPEYMDGSGTDRIRYEIELPGEFNSSDLQVEAKLYYQAIPPYFLQALFDAVPEGPATRRLHFLCANLNLTGTPIENWKLPLVSAVATVDIGEGE